MFWIGLVTGIVLTIVAAVALIVLSIFAEN
jgi:hypothetical protein